MTDQPNRDAIDAVHIGRMTAAKTEWDSAGGTFRGVYAQAERMGVNIPAAKKAMKILAKAELNEFLKDVRDTLGYLRILGVHAEPSQLDFIDEDPSLVPIEEKAWSDGRYAAMMIDGSTANPHDENSKVGKKWADGWRQGRKERELVMAMKMDDEDEADEEEGDGVENPFSQAAE